MTSNKISPLSALLEHIQDAKKRLDKLEIKLEAAKAKIALLKNNAD